MKVPNAQQAIVEREKLDSYLLNSAHPANGGKSAFFESPGFTRLDWETCADALRTVAAESEVSGSFASVHGTKYVVAGTVEGPRGARKGVRTIWIVEPDADVPRLVPLIRCKESVEMIKEHERVVLTRPIPESGLEPGDVGTVVHVYRDGEAYEVEFVTLDGRTAAVVTLEASQVRPVSGQEITHARRLGAA